MCVITLISYSSFAEGALDELFLLENKTCQRKPVNNITIALQERRGSLAHYTTNEKARS